jgi:hypothetical protein
MSFYDDFVVPRLTDLLMHNRLLLPCRKRVIGSAEGRVLEIGIGSGLNIPFYGSAVREIVGMEPSQQLISMARKIAEGATIPVSASRLQTLASVSSVLKVPISEVKSRSLSCTRAALNRHAEDDTGWRCASCVSFTS